jgi:hypothetical protein
MIFTIVAGSASILSYFSSQPNNTNLQTRVDTQSNNHDGAFLPKSNQENQRSDELPTITSANSSRPLPPSTQSDPHSSPTPIPSHTQTVNLSSQKIETAQKMDTALDHINRARALLSRGQLDAALAECNKSLRLEPKNQTANDLKKSINALYKLQKQ